MMIGEQIRLAQEKVEHLERELYVEREVLSRLQSIDVTIARAYHGRHVRRGSLTAEVTEIMARAGRPVTIAEIVHELDAKGVTTTAKCGLRGNAASVLSARTDLFIWIDTNTYDLKERQVENQG
jgi:hypothetical protein